MNDLHAFSMVTILRLVFKDVFKHFVFSRSDISAYRVENINGDVGKSTLLSVLHSKLAL